MITAEDTRKLMPTYQDNLTREISRIGREIKRAALKSKTDIETKVKPGYMGHILEKLREDGFNAYMTTRENIITVNW